MPSPDDQPDAAFIPPADDPSSPDAAPPPIWNWRDVRRRWLEAGGDRFELPRDLDRDEPLGIGSSTVEQLPAALQLLPTVHKGGEIVGLHVARVRGRESVVFEHTWTIGLVQTALKVRTVTAAVEAPSSWPAVVIRPRTGLLRRPRRDELRLEHDQFTRRFRVRAADEDFAILLLGPELQDWLAGRSRATWQVLPGALAVTRPGRVKTDDQDVEASLAALEGFLERVPPEVFDWGT